MKATLTTIDDLAKAHVQVRGHMSRRKGKLVPVMAYAAERSEGYGGREPNIGKMKDDIVAAVKRLPGVEGFDSINGMPKSFEMLFYSSRFDGLFTPRRDEEDDDNPTFTGRGLVIRTVRRAVGPGYRVNAWDHEKGLFSVGVTKVDKLGLTKPEREWFDSHLQDGKLVVNFKPHYSEVDDPAHVVAILERNGALQKLDTESKPTVYGGERNSIGLRNIIELGKNVYVVKKPKTISPARMEKIKGKIYDKIAKLKLPISVQVEHDPYYASTPNTLVIKYEVPGDILRADEYYGFAGKPPAETKKKMKMYDKLTAAIDKLAVRYKASGIDIAKVVKEQRQYISNPIINRLPRRMW
jgi:hypothetical protein